MHGVSHFVNFLRLYTFKKADFVLFDLILYVPSTIFQLNRDRSFWVEPVLSEDKWVLLKDHNTVTPMRLEPAAPRSRVKHSTTEPLRSQENSLLFYIVFLCYLEDLHMCILSLQASYIDLRQMLIQSENVDVLTLR